MSNTTYIRLQSGASETYGWRQSCFVHSLYCQCLGLINVRILCHLILQLWSPKSPKSILWEPWVNVPNLMETGPVVSDISIWIQQPKDRHCYPWHNLKVHLDKKWKAMGIFEQAFSVDCFQKSHWGKAIDMKHLSNGKGQLYCHFSRQKQVHVSTGMTHKHIWSVQLNIFNKSPVYTPVIKDFMSW